MKHMTITYTEPKSGMQTTLSRTLPDDADLAYVLGEMLYGICAQVHTFETHAVYQECVSQIPDHLTSRAKHITLPISADVRTIGGVDPIQSEDVIGTIDVAFVKKTK